MHDRRVRVVAVTDEREPGIPATPDASVSVQELWALPAGKARLVALTGVEHLLPLPSTLAIRKGRILIDGLMLQVGTALGHWRSGHLIVPA